MNQQQSDKDRPILIYTILQESYYLILEQVPAYHLENELLRQCSMLGQVLEHSRLHDHPASTNLTHVFLFKFDTIASARKVKRKMDDSVFYGGQIRVYYAPNRESIQDTRRKLNERQAAVLQHLHPPSRSQRSEPPLRNAQSPCPVTEKAPLIVGPQVYPSDDTEGTTTTTTTTTGKRRRRI